MNKKLLFALFLLFPLFSSAQCIMNCANFCVLSINNLDTTANTIDVTIFNGDTCAVNYPTIVVVDALGDTVINKNNYFYLFQDFAGDTLTQTVPTDWDSIPVGFTGTVYYTDQVWDTTCAFSYPMACTVGINEYLATGSLNIYPNPATDHIHLSMQGIKGNAVITIYDNTGRTVRTTAMNATETDIERGDLRSGIYFISLVSGDHRMTKKVVLE